MKKLFFAILYTLLIISLGGCKTVSKKIEDTTEKEKQKLSKWLNKPEEDLKSFYGQPDKVEFLKTRNRNYVYITEKYKIKCERKFEVNPIPSFKLLGIELINQALKGVNEIAKKITPATKTAPKAA